MRRLRWIGLLSIIGAIALIEVPAANAMKCKNRAYGTGSDFGGCCDEILASGHWWGEDADGMYVDCVGEAIETEEPPPPCADVWDCLPDGTWPWEPPSPPEPWDPGWDPDPTGPGSGGTPNCQGRYCSDGKTECLEDAEYDYGWCLTDMREDAYYRCGDDDGRTGEFRSGLVFEVGDYCAEDINKGVICQPYWETDGRGSVVCDSLSLPQITCEEVCVDSWMDGDGAMLRPGGFKISWKMNSPIPTLSVGFEYGESESYASHNAFCQRRFDKFKSGCDETYLDCRDDQRDACGVTGVTYTTRAPIEIPSFGAGACYGDSARIYLHTYQ